MGTTERRARERDELRQKILRAATELFLENGFETVSMRKIAEKIEYAPSTIYLYFEDKDEIGTAICTEALEGLIRALEEIEQQNWPALEATRKTMRCYLDFALANPHQYLLVFGKTQQKETNEDGALNLLGRRALGFLGHCIVRGRAEGVFAPGDDIADTLASWSHLHGLTMIMITDYGKYEFSWPSAEDLINRGIELNLRSLLVSAQAASS